jgi:hypothetical protein
MQGLPGKASPILKKSQASQAFFLPNPADRLDLAFPMGKNI